MISNGNFKSVSKSPSVNLKYTIKDSPNNEASSTHTKEQMTTSTRPTLNASKTKSVQSTQPSSPIHSPLNGSNCSVKKIRAGQSILLPRKVPSSTGTTVAGENHDPTISNGPSKKESSSFNSTSISVRKDLGPKVTPPNEAVLSVNGQRVLLKNGEMSNVIHWKDNGLINLPFPPHLPSPTANGFATL